MIVDLKTLITLNDDIDKKILFCIVNPEMCNPINKPTMVNGILYFPSEQYFRQWRLNRGSKGIIWMQELVDKNCKKCYGKGNTGTITKQMETPVEEIKNKLYSHLDTDPEVLPQEIVKLMKLPPQMINSLSLLINIATKELTDDGDHNMRVADKYAKIIKHDYVIKETLWCDECFRPNYQDALERARREVKFSIN